MASPPGRPVARITPWRTFQDPAVESSPPQSTFLKAMGTLAIAVGVGAIGVFVLDLHGHSCSSCGNRWRHFGAFNLGDEDSHRCSRCGEVQWWKCGAPDVPHVLRGSQFVVPPTPSSVAQLPSSAPVPAYVPLPVAPPALVYVPPAPAPAALPSPPRPVAVPSPSSMTPVVAAADRLLNSAVPPMSVTWPQESPRGPRR